MLAQPSRRRHINRGRRGGQGRPEGGQVRGWVRRSGAAAPGGGRSRGARRAVRGKGIRAAEVPGAWSSGAGRGRRGVPRGQDARAGNPGVLGVESFDSPVEGIESGAGVHCGGMGAGGERSSLQGRQTSSFFAPMSVRRRSASRLASNGFLKVSLMLDRSKLMGLPSSGSSAIRMVSEKSAFFRRF